MDKELMMKSAISLTIAVGLLAACSTPAQRIADCQAKGVSRDICYLSEQNRQNSIHQAAEEQAMRNAQDAMKSHK